MHCCHRFPLIMDFSHNKMHKEREGAWICHSASNWAVPTERCQIYLVPTWKAKHSQKPNPLSEHLPLHYLFHFTFSPSGYLRSEVCWIKFGFHLYPAREITLSICRREQKWMQCGFLCASVLQPRLSLLALGGVIFSFVKNQWFDLWYYLTWWW